MASLSYSQTPLLDKILYKGNNAFVGNEIVMDSIFNKYKDYEFLLIKHDSLKIKHSLVLITLKKTNLELEFLKKTNESLTESNNIFEQRFNNQTDKHETEILYYKEKAKGKFKAFLYGTAIGGLIVAILTLL